MHWVLVLTIVLSDAGPGRLEERRIPMVSEQACQQVRQSIAAGSICVEETADGVPVTILR
jgi:hypothetical protein